MAKVQAKKASASARKGASPKTASRTKQKSKPAPKPSAKASAKKKATAKPVKKSAPVKKVAAKKATPAKAKAKAKVTAKPVARTKKPLKPIPAKKPKKPAAAPARKVVPPKSSRTAKAVPAKAAKPMAQPKGRPAAQTPPPPKTSVKTAVKAAVKATAKSVVKAATAAAATVVRAVTPAADDKKKRRPRTRITSSGPATAAWFSQGDKPRPSSFIPAPPRAEAPSLVAAPPASSDRLVDANELTEFAVRTVPVRVDIEAGGGKIYLAINPTEVVLHPGEGIEWDFRYLGGADIVIEELVVEFEKPAPFHGGVFRSRRPGAARPHRQLSGPVHKGAVGKRIQYTIRAFNGFKTEMATVKPAVSVKTALTEPRS